MAGQYEGMAIGVFELDVYKRQRRAHMLYLLTIQIIYERNIGEEGYTMEKIRIGIVGYGNIGRGVELAVERNEDMELKAIFTRREPCLLYTSIPLTEDAVYRRFSLQDAAISSTCSIGMIETMLKYGRPMPSAGSACTRSPMVSLNSKSPVSSS